jgi:hypothetical protein
VEQKIVQAERGGEIAFATTIISCLNKVKVNSAQTRANAKGSVSSVPANRAGLSSTFVCVHVCAYVYVWVHVCACARVCYCMCVS